MVMDVVAKGPRAANSVDTEEEWAVVTAPAGREANGINTATDMAVMIDPAAIETVPGRSGRLLSFEWLNCEAVKHGGNPKARQLLTS
jgi:hypothetical protein